MEKYRVDKQKIFIYIIISLTLLGILHYHMLPFMFSMLITYISIENSNKLIIYLKNKNNKLSKDEKYLNKNNINLFSTISIILVVVTIISMIGIGLYKLINSENLSLMINKLSLILEETKQNQQIPQFITNYIPQNTVEIKNQLINLIKDYGNQITSVSKNGIKAFVYILIGIVVGAMISFHVQDLKNKNIKIESYPYFKKTLIEKINGFKISFNNVFIAQFKISLLDTFLTGIYLYIALPIFGIEIPFKFIVLIIAFIVGLIPVVGNLISNTIIIILSLGISVYVALSSLIFLVVIHKLEYFLNAKIIGSQIKATAWELLIIMIISERIFGISGLIVAPIYYAYIKSEMEKCKLI